jgi:hypothetical protein
MNPNTMRLVRRYHLYLGVFFAPAIFFFALSGALQTFRLQEEKGYGGTPPGWIVWMASVHKDSSLPKAQAAHDDDHDHPDDKPAPAAKAPKPPSKHFTLPMKIFALLMSIGLMFSALLGVLIALNSRQTRRMSIAMLVAGSVLPLVLLLL